MKRSSITNWALLILVNAMWAAQYPAYKTASAQIGPVTLSAFCFVIASICLLPFFLRESFRQERLSDRDAACRKRWTGQNVLGFFMTGGLGLIPASAFLAWGTERSTASNAALLYLSVPLITALLAWIVLREQMTPLRWLSLLISLGGVLILSGFDLRHAEFTNRQFLLGNVLVLAACASSSLYNVYSKELLRRFSQLHVLLYGYSIASVLCLPLALWLERPTWASIVHYTPATWFSVAILSTVSWGLAMMLWMRLLTRLDVSQASASIYLLPFLGVLLSVLTLNEEVTRTMLLGGLITLIGTFLITSEGGPQQAEVPGPSRTGS